MAKMSLDDFPDFDDDPFVGRKRAKKPKTKPPPFQITQSWLLDFLYYDQDTGEFTLNDDDPSGQRKAGTVLGGTLQQMVKIHDRQFLLRRLAFLYVTGKIPKYVEHINGDKSDNRWTNLRGFKSKPHLPKFVGQPDYAKKRICCTRCKYTWIEVIASYRRWLRCESCQLVIKGSDLRKAITLI